MKKYLIITLICILIFGCKKNPFDYRAKYLGDYSFAIHSSSWNPLSQLDTTYTMQGKIDYGSDKNTISIFFSGSSVPQEFTIYEDGTIENGGCGGEFESANKIKYSCYWASPGAHASKTVDGEKK